MSNERPKGVKPSDKRAQNTYNEQYGENTQELLLTMLLSDTEAFFRCRSILESEYFDAKFQPVARFIIAYVDEHKIMPSVEQIKAKTEIEIKKSSEPLQHTDYLLKEVEGFCQYKAMELAVLAGVELLQTGRAGEIITRAQAAQEIRLNADDDDDFPTLAELTDQPPAKWIVPQLIPAESVVMLFGASRSFKSFLMIDMAHAIATGRNWHNSEPCEKQSVLIVAAEGQAGIGQRARGLFKVRDEAPIRVHPDRFELTKDTSVADFVAKVQRVEGKHAIDFGVIVVDTISKCAPGADQSDIATVSVIIDKLYQIQRELNATVIAVHHTNKGLKDFNGSYAFMSGSDAVIRVERDGDGFTGNVKVVKMKDDEEIQFPFAVQEIDTTRPTDIKRQTTLVVSRIGDQITRGIETAEEALIERITSLKAKGCERDEALARIGRECGVGDAIPFHRAHKASLKSTEEPNSFNRDRCRKWLPLDTKIVAGGFWLIRYKDSTGAEVISIEGRKEVH